MKNQHVLPFRNRKMHQSILPENLLADFTPETYVFLNHIRKKMLCPKIGLFCPKMLPGSFRDHRGSVFIEKQIVFYIFPTPKKAAMWKKIVCPKILVRNPNHRRAHRAAPPKIPPRADFGPCVPLGARLRARRSSNIQTSSNQEEQTIQRLLQSASQNAHAPSIFFWLKALDRNKCTKHNEKTPPTFSGTIAWNFRAEHVLGGGLFSGAPGWGARFRGHFAPMQHAVASWSVGIIAFFRGDSHS